MQAAFLFFFFFFFFFFWKEAFFPGSDVLQMNENMRPNPRFSFFFPFSFFKCLVIKVAKDYRAKRDNR